MAIRDIDRNRKIYLSSDKYRRREFDIVCAEIKRESEYGKREESKDTTDRKAIHSDIMKLLSQGKEKIEILTFLCNKYPNTNLKRYFGQYIDDHIKNTKKEIADGQER